MAPPFKMYLFLFYHIKQLFLKLFFIL